MLPNHPIDIEKELLNICEQMGAVQQLRLTTKGRISKAPVVPTDTFCCAFPYCNTPSTVYEYHPQRSTDYTIGSVCVSVITEMTIEVVGEKGIAYILLLTSAYDQFGFHHIILELLWPWSVWCISYACPALPDCRYGRCVRRLSLKYICVYYYYRSFAGFDTWSGHLNSVGMSVSLRRPNVRHHR